jgi:hypothetical protein
MHGSPASSGTRCATHTQARDAADTASDRAEAIAFDARHPKPSPHRIAGHAEVMFKRDFRRQAEFKSFQDGTQASRRQQLRCRLRPDSFAPGIEALNFTTRRQQKKSAICQSTRRVRGPGNNGLPAGITAVGGAVTTSTGGVSFTASEISVVDCVGCSLLSQPAKSVDVFGAAFE